MDLSDTAAAALVAGLASHALQTLNLHGCDSRYCPTSLQTLNL